MALPALPVHSLDDPNHQRRSRETINNILNHTFDDSKVRTPAEISAGVTPVNYAYAPFNVMRFGAKADGAADDRGAFASADSTGKVIVPKGSYRIASDLTIANQVTFDSGAVLVPDAGVTVTLSTAFVAAYSQIFDISAAGSKIVLPENTCIVYADWWGAKGDGVKQDNEVPINQATAALSQAGSASSYGGVVILLRGNYYISDTITQNDEVGLEGQGKFFTAIRATPTAFNPSSYMIHISNGTSSLFNSSVKNLRVDASNDGNILACIYAPAWQQKCGPENLWIENFKNYGILVDNNYGGSAQLTFTQIEVFASADCFSGSRCIKFDVTTYSVGWLTVTLNEVQCGSDPAAVTFTGTVSAGATSATLAANWAKSSGSWWVTFSNNESRAVTLTNGATTATWTGGIAVGGATATAQAISPNAIAIDGDGRVILNAQDVHFENTQIGVILNHDANLIGNALKSDGTGTVKTLVQCSGSWAGQINMRGMKRAGSLNYIVDNSRGPYPLANVEPFDGITIWPPAPNKAFASALFSAGGGTPSTSFGSGFTPVSRVGVGQYRFNLTTAASATGSYFVQGSSHDTAASDISISKTSASQFDVFTKSPAGAATDCANFSLQAFHSS